MSDAMPEAESLAIYEEAIRPHEDALARAIEAGQNELEAQKAYNRATIPLFEAHKARMAGTPAPEPEVSLADVLIEQIRKGAVDAGADPEKVAAADGPALVDILFEAIGQLLTELDAARDALTAAQAEIASEKSRADDLAAALEDEKERTTATVEETAEGAGSSDEASGSAAEAEAKPGRRGK